MVLLRALAALAVTALPLLARPLFADRVVLANGRVFDDVVAQQEQDGTVSIDVGGGRLTLAGGEVRSVESAPSTASDYRRRAGTLRATVPARGSESGLAADWVSLARWAHEHGYAFGAREAALEAAALDPSLPELASLMTAIGFARDAATGEWLPYDEAMRRKGYILDAGEWIAPDVYRARLEAIAAADDLAAREAEAERADRVAALAELEASSSAASEVAYEPAGFYFPFGGAPFGGGFSGRRHFHSSSRMRSVVFARHAPLPPGHLRSGGFGSALVSRQPGSLIPIHSRGW